MFCTEEPVVGSVDPLPCMPMDPEPDAPGPSVVDVVTLLVGVLLPDGPSVISPVGVCVVTPEGVEAVTLPPTVVAPPMMTRPPPPGVLLELALPVLTVVDGVGVTVLLSEEKEPSPGPVGLLEERGVVSAFPVSVVAGVVLVFAFPEVTPAPSTVLFPPCDDPPCVPVVVPCEPVVP